jgi:xylan 1,4-beta-xylosidase
VISNPVLRGFDPDPSIVRVGADYYIATSMVVLHARIEAGTLRFGWGRPGEPLVPIGPPLDASTMSDETTRGFAGTMVGISCQDGYRRRAHAHFAYFDLRHGDQALL